MTTCPDRGAWRAWLDHEEYDPRLDEHLETCSTCTAEVTDLRAAQAVATQAMRSLGAVRLPSADETALARERFAWRQRRLAVAGAATALPAEIEPVPAARLRIPTPWRIAASGLAAAMLLSVLVTFTDEGRTAAAAFLAQFRSQQVAAIEVSPQSQAEIMRTLSALGNLGTVRTPSGATTRPGGPLLLPQPSAVSLAEASRQVGFALQTPDPATLPAGVDKTPQVQVIPANEVRFTFDKAKASGYYRSTGRAEVSLPDKFDGATLVVSTPAAALLQYSAKDSHQELLIGQSGELVVNVEGKVSLDEMRDFLLGLPGLPKDTTDQLRMIRNWNETLPIPIPSDKINWKQERFKGAQGLLLNDNTGVGSAAIWQSGGHLYGVAGSLKANDLKRVAESLAVR
jgi:hypothetical protein